MTDTFEEDFWGNCANTWGEEQKHFVYARHMGLTFAAYPDPKNPQTIGRVGFDLRGKSVLDIGGGPVSMLLKSHNFSRAKVVDPLQYPSWVYARYGAANIFSEVRQGELITEDGWDEVWIYNVLQHTDDPEKVIQNARKAAPSIRIFEWIDIPAHEGHPHMLTEAKLREWLGIERGETSGPVGTAQLNESGCFGRAFFGNFRW